MLDQGEGQGVEVFAATGDPGQGFGHTLRLKANSAHDPDPRTACFQIPDQLGEMLVENGRALLWQRGTGRRGPQQAVELSVLATRHIHGPF